MTSERILQRLIIAEAIVQGTRIAAIARRLGVSRSWTSREANAPETRMILAAIVEKRADAIGQLLDRALKVIEDAFKATKLIRCSGITFKVPDHGMRLEAIGLFIGLLSTSAMRTARFPTSSPKTCLPSKVVDRAERIEKVFEADLRHRMVNSRADYKSRFEAVRVLIRLLAKLPAYAHVSR